MPRFIYNAVGMGLGGHITRPADHHIGSLAPVVLPSTGGNAVATAGPYSLTLSNEFILSFDSAETTIQGSETAPGVHNTLITSIVRNLNVLNELKTDQLICKLNLIYDTNTDQVTIDTTGSSFGNLTIGGQQFGATLDHDLARQAANYKKFLQDHPEHKEVRGAVRSALGRHRDLHFEDPYDQGWYHHPNFGRIYFSEWSAAPNTQHLTMLRLKLGSPADGDINAGGGGGNGTPYP